METVLRRIRAAVPNAHVLVVDDGSPDGTADLAEKVGADVGAVDIIRRTAKSGLGSAYRAGFSRSRLLAHKGKADSGAAHRRARQ